MGIKTLAKGNKTNLEDLRVGQIYSTALIIERDGHDMVTLRKVDDEIQVERYLIKVDGHKVTSIELDGGQEYYSHDKEYAGLDKKLKEVGVATIE